MLTIYGTRMGGVGVAGAVLRRQLPLIAREFPEISDCFPGTINLNLGAPLLVAVPDHRTRPLSWDGPGSEEVFDLLRVQLEAPRGAAPLAAWLFIAHRSPHRRTPHVHELIAPELVLDDHAEVTLRINRQYIQLPYRKCPVTVIVQ